MSSRSLAASLFVAAAVVPAAASAQSLTRIETHNFYGATVTIEEGVRVFRGLPPTSVMVINPGGRTPLSLSYNYNTTIIDGPSDGGSAGGVVSSPRTNYGWGGVGYGGHGFKRHHPGLKHVKGRPRVNFLAPGRRGHGGHH